MKREALIVSANSLTVGASSLIFYSILTAKTGASEMASFIIATAIAAIVQIVLVPNTMIFVYSAGTVKRRNHSVFYSVMFELAGIAAGAILLGFATPILPYGSAILVAFLGFGMAGSSACVGYLRAGRKWVMYTLGFVLPSVMRLLLILFDVTTSQVPDELHGIIGRYFLVPEILRYTVVVFPIFLRHLRVPRWKSMKRAFRMVFHNWLYDGGSAMAEVGDRVILSAVLSPTLLVAYFFARRLGAATTVILEPFYAINFKIYANAKRGSFGSRNLLTILAKGYMIGGTLAMATWAFLFLALSTFESSSHFIPPFVLQLPITFAALIMIDSMISANRWSRHISLLDRRAFTLMGKRLLCLAAFVCIVWVWPAETKAIGLIVGFATFAVSELAFLYLRIHEFGAKST